MLRLFFVLVLAMAGAAWFWADDLWPSATAHGASVVLQRPVTGASQPLRSRPELRRQAEPPANSLPSSKLRAEPEPAVSEVLAGARKLAAGGAPSEALDLLRQRMTQPASRESLGELAWETARLTENGAERRQLLGQALASGAVSGREYAEAGSMLVVLNRNPRVGLLDSIATQLYRVQPGDSLWKICNKTLTTKAGGHHEPGLLRLLNGMSSDSLHAGQSLLVPEAPLRIEIDRSGHGLVAWLEDIPIVAYEVGLGKEERTPSGEFLIQVKQQNPTWYKSGRAIPHGDPENILGTRWMGFENQPGVMGYGIHGTELPDSVGLDESMGCVRMRNPEVEELFELVSRGTRVIIP